MSAVFEGPPARATDQFLDPNAMLVQSDAQKTSSFLWLCGTLLLRLVGLVMVGIPSTVLQVLSAVLSANLSITLSFYSLLAILVVISGVLYFVIRYRYLTAYSRLTSEPQRIVPTMDVLLPKEDSQSRFGSYLDEFLSAIKIFGYLEKAVFQELTKNMTTQKLAADEILLLDPKLGFSIVVEGNVRIYSKVSGANLSTDTMEDDTYMLESQRYQLLNEVKSGAPLSSLSSTLSLFESERDFSGTMTPRNSTVFQTMYERGTGEFAIIDSPTATPLATPNLAPMRDSDLTPVLEADYPDIIARASTEATIAIIPASAFVRILRKYPRACSHIVQMVLTRLYRVTFQTAHNYLGLTHEIFSSEIKLNESAKYELPSYLHDGVIQKFRTTLGDETTETPTSPITSRRNSISLSRNDSSDIVSLNMKNSKFKLSKPGHLPRISSRFVILDSRNTSNPGDLLSSVPLSRKEHSEERTVRNWTFSAEEETEDTALRIALIESIFQLLGITKDVMESQLFSNRTSSTDLSSLTGSISFRSRLFSNTSEKFFFDTASNEDEESSEKSRTHFDFDSIKKVFADSLEVVFIKKGTAVIEQQKANNGLYYVVDGLLEVGYKDLRGSDRVLYTVKPGGLAGYLGSLLGYRSMVTVVAKSDTYAGFINKETFDKLIDKFYILQLPVAKRLVGLLSKQILQMDFALEWVQTEAGNVLSSQNDMANGIHIVLNGRFRSVQETSNHPENTDVIVLAEHGQGESIGEVEVLTASKRNSSIVAVRDSETARIPRSLFEMLALQNPSIMIKVSRIIANRMAARTNDFGGSFNNISSNNGFSKSVRSSTKTTTPLCGNYRTITILPVTSGLPVTEFAEKLVSAFKAIDRSVISLNQASTLSHLGKHAFDRLAKLKESGYFSYLEERFQTVVYVCDTPVKSTWTRTCVSQGDCILLLGDALAEPDIGEYEKLLLKTKTSARTELCLLHPERFVEPGSTNKWLKNRMWVHSHHHIQMEFDHNEVRRGQHSNSSVHLNSLPLKIVGIGSRVQDIFKLKPPSYRGKNNYNTPGVQPHKSDFLRLARLLSNKAVGLVLGGGGARGLAHVGVVMALEKHGIPVDIVGGTSIGSFVGGLYAKEYDLVPIYGRVKKFASRLSSIWRMVMDLTYPVTSYITGYEFNRGIWKALGDSRIEDFWVKYFVNTTNITNSTMDIHEIGYSWRYIRASMSLAGLLPPITDNGSMLLDGGYIDNLPVLEMKNRGANIVFAVDVGSIDDRSPMSYGDTLSGFWVLVNRWNPFSKHPNVPNMAEIQMRLAYVSSVNALEIAKSTPGVIYLRPPIDKYGTLDFGRFEEIYNVGALYADALFTEWENNETMPMIPGVTKRREEHRISVQRRNSI